MEWSTVRRELSHRGRKRLYVLGSETLVTYVRMSCTVVVAVVVRLCFDCVGIISTGQDPEAVVFWFAHCQQDGGQCVAIALSIFTSSLCGASFFAWACQEWILDSKRNQYAEHFSFKILLDAASWVPISVGVGKTNALVEWCMDVTQDDLVQLLLSTGVVLFLTLCCALLTHISMKHCQGVASQAQVREAGWTGYGKFLILTTLSCLGWAVGWSLWAMVMALMDALQPGRSVHTTALVVVVISLAVICTTCFYLRYGPEPVIPDPLLQQLCYSHGYSNSVRRALVSYLVYACMVFLVMSFCDPTYGLLHVVASDLQTELDPSGFDVKALMVLLGICFAATFLSSLISSAITRLTGVDMETSMKLSRSAYEVRLRLGSSFSGAELLGYEQMMRHASDNFEDDDPICSPDIAGGPPPSPRCSYSALEMSENGDDRCSPNSRRSSFSSSEGSRRQLVESMDELHEPENRIAISRSICASVLVYDVLAFVVCTLWGTFAVRTFFVVFGRLAAMHSLLYVITCVTYASLTTIAVTRVCLTYFPSAEERRLHDFKEEHTEEASFERAPQELLESLETFTEPFLEM